MFGKTLRYARLEKVNNAKQSNLYSLYILFKEIIKLILLKNIRLISPKGFYLFLAIMTYHITVYLYIQEARFNLSSEKYRKIISSE
jgi:hypothetical protein